MTIVAYKDFELSPCPHQFGTTGEWIVRVSIAKHNDRRGETRKKQFCSSRIFHKKGDAIHHAILFGKEVIDGKHMNLTVENL